MYGQNQTKKDIGKVENTNSALFDKTWQYLRVQDRKGWDGTGQDKEMKGKNQTRKDKEQVKTRNDMIWQDRTGKGQ